MVAARRGGDTRVLHNPLRRSLVAHLRDDLHRDARIFGPPRPRRDNDARRLGGANLVEGDGVVAHHKRRGAKLAQILHEVISERIVVVEEKNHRPQPESVSCISHEQAAARKKTNMKV